MGLISPMRQPDGDGVTNDELDVLLTDEPCPEKQPSRPFRLKIRRKKTAPKKS
jgi:hypothetical protein